MKTITISKSDFNINNQNSIDAFNNKLREIDESFEVEFNYNIKEIPSYLFFGTSLTRISILPSIEKLGYFIFYNCLSLKEITILMSKEKFLETVKNAQYFYDTHKNIITFEDKPLDVLLSKNNSLESIISFIEPER